MSRKTANATVKKQSSVQWDKFGDEDFKLSDEDEVEQNITSSNKKFIKKQTVGDSKQVTQNEVAKKLVPASSSQLSSTSKLSATLNKLKLMTSNKSQEIKNKLTDNDSDDLDVSISLDEDIVKRKQVLQSNHNVPKGKNYCCQ